jgi:hypothetical protein
MSFAGRERRGAYAAAEMPHAGLLTAPAPVSASFAWTRSASVAFSGTASKAICSAHHEKQSAFRFALVLNTVRFTSKRLPLFDRSCNCAGQNISV